VVAHRRGRGGDEPLDDGQFLGGEFRVNLASALLSRAGAGRRAEPRINFAYFID
jgi:hypothetical protein